jgi:quinol monooxygenase YgiN
MDELQSIVRFTFHAGMVEEFKRLSAECIEIVRSKDVGTLQYDTYFNDDESQAIVLERFRDSDALILHGQNMAPLVEAIMATGTPRRAPGRPERAAPDPTRRQPGRCIRALYQSL